MDVRAALITELHNRLTGDAALKALCILPGEGVGTVRLSNGMAQPDTKLPYLTHRVDLVVPDTSWALLEGTWLLDLWDHGPNRDRIWAIHARVITLMDRLIFTPAGEEIVAAQVFLRTDREGPTDAASVYRLMLEWALHLDRQGEVERILTR